ncbi:P-loop containing nucleoside triphosphate hydrolase protein [Penicillium sp. IBT 16267x]|nr:P-loop containing nucleoside triphosphate hydrolase protein [Penicillium sp. IBT 16267x]
MASAFPSSLSFGNGNRGFQVGINNGNVYLLPEPPETPLAPLSTVPFRRDSDFVDRGTILDQMNEKSSVPECRITLVGLGGVGKSQLAIEYCYRVRDQSPETWVLWIHASNAARFIQSCRHIADLVMIPGRQTPNASILKLLHDWMHAKNGQWILVLDNLDDDRFLLEIPSVEQGGIVTDQRDTPGRSIWEYFPETLNGPIIMTTRSRHVALRTQYSLRGSGVQATREDVIQLTAALELMPLAIVQAAAYIKRRLPRMSIITYVEKFRQSDRQKIRLLNYDEGNLRRDQEASNSILTTWQMSFKYIRQIRPAAADLLSLMSFFDRQGIPESLLQEEKEMKHNVSTYNKDQPGDISDVDHSASNSTGDTFEDDILVLRDYSLISISADETNFEIHQLIQLAIQEWLKAHGQLENWKDRAITHQPVSKDSLENWASLLYTAAWFADTQGDDINCQKWAEMAKLTRMKLFGPEDERTLSSFKQLGSAYAGMFQMEKAKELQVHVLNTRNKVLGPKHHDTLSSMTDLASTYRISGLLKQAEALQKQVVDTRQQVFGPRDLSTLSSRGYLASIYNDQGRWKEAELLHKQVVDTYQQVSGPEASITLHSMDSLAFIYRGQGQLKQAEALQLQVLHTRQKVLGQNHRNTADNMRDLGSIYYHQGRWKEAEELWVQVLDLYQQIFGPRHPSTLNIMVRDEIEASPAPERGIYSQEEASCRPMRTES